MEKERYLKTDFRRLLKISSVSGDSGVAVSFTFSLENYAFEKGMVNFNVMDTYIYAVEMSGKMIAYAFCASALLLYSVKILKINIYGTVLDGEI